MSNDNVVAKKMSGEQHQAIAALLAECIPDFTETEAAAVLAQGTFVTDSVGKLLNYFKPMPPDKNPAPWHEPPGTDHRLGW